jgi:hypothetical protein
MTCLDLLLGGMTSSKIGEFSGSCTGSAVQRRPTTQGYTQKRQITFRLSPVIGSKRADRLIEHHGSHGISRRMGQSDIEPDTERNKKNQPECTYQIHHFIPRDSLLVK